MNSQEYSREKKMRSGLPLTEGEEARGEGGRGHKQTEY